jgi:D-arabinose 1-dehydrogenase-like Zn-dependent alcohol dehydrogenase
MFHFFQEKKITPVKGKVFSFENIKDAVTAQESGSVNGKIIVEMTDK